MADVKKLADELMALTILAIKLLSLKKSVPSQALASKKQKSLSKAHLRLSKKARLRLKLTK